MTDDTDTDVHAELARERLHNRLYRGVLNDDVPLEEEDIDRLSETIGELSDEESTEFGKLILAVEDADRDGLAFDEITEAEREYYEFLVDHLEDQRGGGDGS